MKARPSARILVIDSQWRVLLFHFAFNEGPLAGRSYWATPGGEVEEGETFQQAAVRELFEETGIRASEIGEAVAKQNFPLQLPDGSWVEADERFFLVRVAKDSFSSAGWTATERETIADHRWWTTEEISAAAETIYPENLVTVVTGLRTESAKWKYA